MKLRIDGLPTAGSLRQWAQTGVASRKTLAAAIASGELRASRPTRRTVILRADVLAWLEQHPVRSQLAGSGDESGGERDVRPTQ